MHGLKDLLSETVDDNTWKGYVVRNLEDLNTSVTKLTEGQEKINDKLDKALNKCEGCEIESVVIAVYGDKEGNIPGLFTKLSNLETAFKIKSSMWGVLGGGIISALSAIVYFLIKNGLPALHITKSAEASVTKLIGQ